MVTTITYIRKLEWQIEALKAELTKLKNTKTK